jgi:hypothetical protein
MPGVARDTGPTRASERPPERLDPATDSLLQAGMSLEDLPVQRAQFGQRPGDGQLAAPRDRRFAVVVDEGDKADELVDAVQACGDDDGGGVLAHACGTWL